MCAGHSSAEYVITSCTEKAEHRRSQWEAGSGRNPRGLRPTLRGPGPDAQQPGLRKGCIGINTPHRAKGYVGVNNLQSGETEAALKGPPPRARPGSSTETNTGENRTSPASSASWQLNEAKATWERGAQRPFRPALTSGPPAGPRVFGERSLTGRVQGPRCRERPLSTKEAQRQFAKLQPPKGRK